MRFSAALFSLAVISAQDAVTIHVDAAKARGPFKPIYGYFGYDEPNFTYTRDGRNLISSTAHLLEMPVYFRTHFLLATGNGAAGFKFGSTNAYTEDPTGTPIYDWSLVDRILDTYVRAGARPFVEIGFMPKALSSSPEPYTPHWSPGDNFNQYYLGWSYPPKDYAKWSALIEQWVRHEVQRNGKTEVESWYWEVWNEPDIAYWHGTPEEYDALYDAAAAAVKRALPSARIGGPASTGPASAKAAAFLKQFLQHCSDTAQPLDFISFHAKGRPMLVDGHVRMGIANNAQDVDRGFEIVRQFPKFQNLPIVLSESDPDGCAACSARVYPQNAYRNGPLYASYTAAMLKTILELADRSNTNIEGMLTWAFEFEDQPSFDGFRTLATNGVYKPVFNLFRMMARMSIGRDAQRLESASSGRVALPEMLSEGVRGAPDVDALAVRTSRAVSVLVWNYHDDDLAASTVTVRIGIDGLRNGPATFVHYRIDDTHSNSWTAWRKMGSPPHPSPAQQGALIKAGDLEQLEHGRTIMVERGRASFEITLPRQAVSLLQLSIPL